MKKLFIGVCITSCLGAGFFIFSINKTLKAERIHKNKVLQLNNITVLESNIPKNNKPSIVIAYDVDCEYCQSEAKMLKTRKKDLDSTNIVLFTYSNDSLINEFAKKYGLDSLKNITFLSDTTGKIHTFFKIKSIPAIFVYNKNGQLVNQYQGETKIENILADIQ
jgi:predicted DCC family thiol-disulfide oxidoreductase YuxK